MSLTRKEKKGTWPNSELSVRHGARYCPELFHLFLTTHIGVNSCYLHLPKTKLCELPLVAGWSPQSSQCSVSWPPGPETFHSLYILKESLGLGNGRRPNVPQIGGSDSDHSGGSTRSRSSSSLHKNPPPGKISQPPHPHISTSFPAQMLEVRLPPAFSSFIPLFLIVLLA